MALRFTLMAALAAAILTLAVTAPAGSSSGDRAAPAAQRVPPALAAPLASGGG